MLQRLAKRTIRHATTREKGPILVNSVPKAGTHMLRSMVLTLPSLQPSHDLAAVAWQESAETQTALLVNHLYDLRPSLVYTAHIPYSPQAHAHLQRCNVRHLFIYRDPRDIAVSLMHFIMRQQANLYAAFAALPHDDARLLAVIEGLGAGRERFTYGQNDALPSLAIMLNAFKGWLAQPDTFALRYEQIIGPNGQPAPAAETTVAQMIDWLGFDSDTATVGRMLDLGLQPQRAKTYRQGTSGGWRDVFRPNHHAAWQAIAEQLDWALAET